MALVCCFSPLRHSPSAPGDIVTPGATTAAAKPSPCVLVVATNTLLEAHMEVRWHPVYDVPVNQLSTVAMSPHLPIH